MIKLSKAKAKQALADYLTALDIDYNAAVAVERRLDVFGHHPQDVMAGLQAAAQGKDGELAIESNHRRRTRPHRPRTALI